MPGLEMFRQ